MKARNEANGFAAFDFPTSPSGQLRLRLHQ
jgi:hypothetical protein